MYFLMLRGLLGHVRKATVLSGEALGLIPMQPWETLYDLSEHENLKQWQVVSDKDFGGFSEAQLTFCKVRSEEEEQRLQAIIASAEEAQAADDGEESDWEADEEETPEAVAESATRTLTETGEHVGFAEFAGTISTEVSGQMVRSGFASIQPKEWDPPLDLCNFEGLEVRVRTDGRPYFVTVRQESWQADDLYMGLLQPPADEWVTVQLGFRHLTLTCNGFVMEHQRELDHPIIERVGFTLADVEEGPFKIDVAWVRAVRELAPFDSDAEREAAARGQLPQE